LPSLLDLDYAHGNAVDEEEIMGEMITMTITQVSNGAQQQVQSLETRSLLALRA
jgi:hypothetical protein